MEGNLIIKTKSLEPIPNYGSYSLLLPSVSVGNVGQLSVDVLISSLKTTKVGILHHPALLPIIGYDPYDNKSDEVFTAADLHISEQNKLLLLQIRSPLITEERESFLKDLSAWIKKSSFKSVVILGSCHAHLRHDCQLIGSQFRYLTNDATISDIDLLRENGAIELEEREDSHGVMKRQVPGAGFMYQFLDICKVPSVAILKFVDEGDNTKDALSLVSFLNDWTKYQETDQWEIPFSWKNLFGASPPSLMY